MYRNALTKAAVSQELIKKEGRRLRLYFVGIGGSGMYPLARLAAALGYEVRGSDAVRSENTERLMACGIPVCVGKEPLPEDVDALVLSLAISEADGQVREGRERGIPVFMRAELLTLLERRFPLRLAVAGSHGKSSTVGMCASILKRAGRQPTVLLGADLSSEDGGFKQGAGEILLYEACEYRSALLTFAPTHALVLNGEWEHTDCFCDKDAVLGVFRRFLAGSSVRVALAPRSIGFLGHADFGADGRVTAACLAEREGKYAFLLCKDGVELGKVRLSVAGKHQVENALAAASLALSLGIEPSCITEGLSSYSGIGRRMERIGVLSGSPLYLDYAHHPTELACALSTASCFGKRTVCVFEPHTYSRVHAFWGEYVRLLSHGATAVLPIYAARETNLYGVDSQKLAVASGAEYLSDYAAAAEYLIRMAGRDSVLLLAGAGRIFETLSFLKDLIKE